MLPLSNTDNKKAIRQSWDRLAICRFQEAIDQPRLTYFGLPGPDIEDFRDWGDLLAWKTGIELLTTGKDREAQLARINRLQSNVMRGGYSDNWELRKGKLEDIVLNGTDIDGNKPKLLIIEKHPRPHMEYDLHNWDFQGGLGYSPGKVVVYSTQRRIHLIFVKSPALNLLANPKYFIIDAPHYFVSPPACLRV